MHGTIPAAGGNSRHAACPDRLSAFIRHSDLLRERYLSHLPVPMVVIAGACNAGKSTLINALLGLEVSPVDVLPLTPCPIVFRHGETFSATLQAEQRKWQAKSLPEALNLLRRNHHGLKQVEMHLSVPWLQKCSLVDTPGIDTDRAGAGFPAGVISGADLILYLFHQRGADDGDRYFLHRLRKTFLPRDYGRISFWINGNLGRPDGSALEATRTVLQEIFGREIALHHLDTRNGQSVDGLRRFLEVELAFLHLARMGEMFKKEDALIPRQLAKAA
ncbi:MAG: dynamin family protein [Thermoanaerobacteraceae bacterium]|nr:dynamin family protein [Thermoanaerobacteraceae bacterium]